MITFLDYITEETAEESKGKALKHLTHVEDNVIYHGHEGVSVADHHLNSVHQALLGKKSGVHISTKWDGAPSIVFGHHPDTNKFFVASKSAFNKNPKINYTDEDIENNHGHAPGLVDKLKTSLKHLPAITPHGVFQGDLLHTAGDAKSDKHQTSITPNTITYSAPNGSAEAENMKKKLGVVVHTQYKGGKNLSAMTAEPLDDKTRSRFKQHPDVNNVDPTLHVNPSNYTPADQRNYIDHMENARASYAKMKPEAMDALQGHGVALETHVNDTVRKGTTPSVKGYADHITAKHEKEIAKLSNPASIERKVQAHANVMQHINDNKDHFKAALDLHNHFQKAKDVLTNVMAKNSPYAHSVGGVATSPEGAVVFDKNKNASKFVNRAEFSRQNFLKGSFSQAQAKENE